jgi:hypothetical protein
MEICANICSRKLLVLAKEYEYTQPGNLELKRKEMKRADMQIYCIRESVYRDITHWASTSMFDEYSCKFSVKNCN